MSQYYDFIDHKDFLKQKQKKQALQITEFDNLCKERDEFFSKLLFKAYCITNGNVSAMARGLKYSRNTIVKYLIKLYGEQYLALLKQEQENKQC